MPRCSSGAFGAWLRLILSSTPRRVLFAALVAWLVVYFLAVTPAHKPHGHFLTRNDGTWMYLQMRSHLLDRDWRYENDYRLFGAQPNGVYTWEIWLDRLPNGEPRNPWTMGTGWMLAPFFLLGHGLVLAANLFGAGLQENGISLVHQYSTLAGSVLYAFLGLLLIFRMSAARFGETPALVGCLAVLLSSPLFFYTTYNPSYSHAVDFFCTAALLGWWDQRLRVRPVPVGIGSSGASPEEATGRQLTLPLPVDPSSRSVVAPPGGEHGARGQCPSVGAWLVFGLLVGLAALVRPQLVVFALPGALSFVGWAVRMRRQAGELVRLGLSAFAAVAASLVVFAPQMLFWKDLYGAYLIVPQGAWFMRYEASFLWETLFSARGGLFPVTPALWFAALGLLLCCRRAPVEAALFTGILLLNAFVNGAAWDFWAGGTLGARRMTCTVTVLMFGAAGLVAILRDLARRRAALMGWIGAAALFLPILLFTQWEMRQLSRDPGMSSHLPDRDMTFFYRRFIDDAKEQIGNPFTYPRSLWMRLRHGVPLGLYSRLTTDFPLELPPPWEATGFPSRRQVELDLIGHRWRKVVASGAELGDVPQSGRAWLVRDQCLSLWLLLRIRYDYELGVQLVARPAEPPGGQPANGSGTSDRISLAVGGRQVGERHLPLSFAWRAPVESPTVAAGRGATGKGAAQRTQWVSFTLPRQVVSAGLNTLVLCGPRGRLAVRRLRLAYQPPRSAQP